MSKVPGMNASHRIITDNCRTRGEDIVIEEALDSLRQEYHKLKDIWEPGNGHKFHVVLSIERGGSQS